MESEILIPEFKRKELNLQYLSETFEDESRCKFKILWTVMEDFHEHLDLSQILRLMDYREKADLYANELICLLTGEPFRDYMTNQRIRFMEEYHPESQTDKLIFNIFKSVCDELFWINDILEREEKGFLNGD